MAWRLVFVALAAVGLLGSGCGEEAAAPSERATSDETRTPPGKLTPGTFAGTAAKPRKPAPPLALEDSLGRRIDVDRYRGKAVLVTFIYTNCPDVCPIIVGNLRTAQAQLGAQAEDLEIIAVSVDPEGDTPSAVNQFLEARRMKGRMEYLIGSRPELERVWSDWDIVSRRSPKRNKPDLVEHSALIYGIGAGGEITTLYPTSFDPEQIVHDVPILATR